MRYGYFRIYILLRVRSVCGFAETNCLSRSTLGAQENDQTQPMVSAPAPWTAAERALALRTPHSREYVPRGCDIGLTRSGQPDPAGQALEDRDAKRILDLAHGTAHSRDVRIQLQRRRAEAAAVRCRNDHA